MDRATYRRIMIGALVTLLAVVAFVWIVNPLGDDAALPEPLEAVFPLPGDTVVRQTVVEVDLPAGYAIEMEIDGIRIPPNEIGFIEGTGLFSWGPGPASLWETWDAGEHTVVVRWDRVDGSRPAPGQFTWTFRVA